MNQRLTYHKQKLSKSLLALSLFVSVFIFSPSTENSQSQVQQSTQTELVLAKNNKTAKRTISFLKAFQNKHLTSAEKYDIQALRMYNKLILVDLKTISKRLYSFKIPDRFVQIKTIPQGSDDPIFSFLIG